MENILTTILLFIITGLLSSIALGLKKHYHRVLNRMDLLSFKTTSIDFACERTNADGTYKKFRDEKFEDLIEEDELKNKNR